MISIDTADKLNNEVLSDYFKGKRRSPIYEETSKLYKALKIHADGLYPHELIDKRRPHESEYVHAFRKEIYKAVTKETISAIINSLSKIRRSADWSVDYEEENVKLAGIPDEETLEQYCEYDFPYYKSITNWTFSILLKEYLVDANALLVICPLKEPKDETEYLKPYPIVFHSDQILDFIEDEYAILKSLNKYKYTDSKKEGQQGNMWYVVTSLAIDTYAEVNDNKDISVINSYKHGLGYIPIVKMKGIFLKSHEEYSVLETRINCMIPRLDEAVREYSDQQGAVVNNLYPEKWEFASQPCMMCRDMTSGVSTGKILEMYGKQQKQRYVVCPGCNGSGNISPSGPYKKFIVRPSKQNMGETPAPIPPLGYIQKADAVAMIEAMDKRIDAHQYKALASINMQFLSQVPLSISGDAKMVDKDELNNFVHSIAEDLIGVMEEIYQMTADYRYRFIVPAEEKREKMCPSIPVPEKFDLLSSQTLLEEMTTGKTAGLNGTTLMAYEIDFCNKTFYDRPEVRDELQLVFELDPLPAKTTDEKLATSQSNGCTEIDYIISCNILPFVKRAMFEDDEFFKKPFDEKNKVMQGYADEKMQVISMKKEADQAAAMETAAAQGQATAGS